MKLNYGCGRDYREGWFNVDHSLAVKADFYGTLSQLREESDWKQFDYVLLKHVFEHIDDQMTFMEDLYTVCNPEATIQIICPYWSSMTAWSDPDHKRPISEDTFVHFDRKAYLRDPGNNPITAAHSDRFLPDCDFETVHHEFVIDDKFMNATDDEKAYAVKHLVNVVKEYRVRLRCIKPARISL